MADKEIELLESVEMRFAMADTDAKFEKAVATLLAPVLVKLESPHDAVRNKVMSICAHVSKRLKANVNLKVPVAALLDLFVVERKGLFVRNFSLIYLEMGFARLSAEEAQSLIPKLVVDVSKRIQSQQQTIMSIALSILAEYKLKKPSKNDPPLPVDPFAFESKPDDLKFLLDFFLDVILYTVPSTTALKEGEVVPPSLSKNAVDFITNSRKASWTVNPQELQNIKLGLIRFTQTTGVVPEKVHPISRFLLFVAASADTNHLLVSAGEDGLKRNANPNYEDPAVVSGLYTLYLGTTSRTPGPPESIRSPGTPQLKHRCLTFMMKSAAAANEFPAVLQVAFDALYGESSISKLRSAGMAFVQWIARMAADAKIKAIAAVLLSGLLKFINETVEDKGQENETLRGFAYESVGLLSKRAPNIFESDIDVLSQFFDAVSMEQRNVRVSVQEALSMMVDAYKDVTKNDLQRQKLEDILMKTISKPEQQARYVAAKYANALFPFSHPLARYIDLVAASDSKIEVREEGRRGLVIPPAPTKGDTSNWLSNLPSVQAVGEFVSEMVKKPVIVARTVGVRYVGSLTAETYSNALEFMRRLLVISAHPTARFGDISPSLASEAEDGGKLSDITTRTALRKALKERWNQEDRGGLDVFLRLIEGGLREGENDAVLQSVASTCLLELVSLGPSALADSYRDKAEWIKSFLSSIKFETRVCMARVLGIVCSSGLSETTSKTYLISLIEGLCGVAEDNSKQTTLESRHGAILALGHIIGRVQYRHPKNWMDIVPADLAARATINVAKQLDASSNHMVLGACIALAEIGRYGGLPIGVDFMDVDEPAKAEQATPTAEASETWTVSKVLDKLMVLGKATKDAKLQETAIVAIGHIALSTPTQATRIFDFFYSLPPLLGKHVEVNFTVGEALCAASAGWRATSMEEYLDIADVTFPPDDTIATPPKDSIDALLKKCFADVKPGGSSVVRKGVCVWLLSIVKFCGRLPEVKKHLHDIHNAFSSLIADRDEFTQEVASKGIGLVYELGDESIKSLLVSSLVSTLSEGRKLAPQSVSADTQLFTEGALGNTMDGTSLSTYQSILSLASDMSQPDLVYKFMSLASHNAIWNSRRGASMGFSSIAAHAEAELAPYLPQLVPKLYRFQFDPNVKVAESMKSIWRSLVKEPKKAVDDQFEDIMKDLLNGLEDRLWRIREASCSALSDLVHGRQLLQLEKYLQQLWTLCFARLDDIKETVRVAAFTTCKTLTNITVRYCDPTVVSIPEGQRIINIVMPLFLTKGLASKAEDVHKFSLSTILKIAKKGGVLLKPHLTDLVSTLLEGLSSMEPQVMNYLAFHTDKYNITQDQLDSSRLSAAKASPMMDAIETAVEHIDEEIMGPLIEKVNTIVRKGVGLPTKAGCARFIVSLTMRIPGELKPYADSVLKALSGAIADRSASVRKSFATAMGHIVKLCSPQQIGKLMTHLRNMYTEAEDEEGRSVPGIAILEISRYSSDALSRHYSEVLPLAFIGRKDATEAISSVWSSVWEENTPGVSGAVKLYLVELVAVCTSLISTSPSWTVKKQVGSAFTEMAKAIGASIASQMDAIIPILIDALGGRTWEGKEAVLQALVVTCVEGKVYFSDGKNAEKLEEVTKVVIREAKKNNRQYKRYALEYLGLYMNGLELNKFDELKEYLFETALADDMDDDDVDESKAKPLGLAIRANGFKAVGLVWPKDKLSQESNAASVLEFLTKNVDGHVWNIRLAVLESFTLFFEKMVSFNKRLFTEHALSTTITALFKSVDDGKFTAIRESTGSVIRLLITRLKDSDLMTEQIKSSLLSGIDVVISKEVISSIVEPLKDIRKEISGMDVS